MLKRPLRRATGSQPQLHVYLCPRQGLREEAAVAHHDHQGALDTGENVLWTGLSEKNLSITVLREEPVRHCPQSPPAKWADRLDPRVSNTHVLQGKTKH